MKQVVKNVIRQYYIDTGMRKIVARYSICISICFFMKLQ